MTKKRCCRFRRLSRQLASSSLLLPRSSEAGRLPISPTARCTRVVCLTHSPRAASPASRLIPSGARRLTRPVTESSPRYHTLQRRRPITLSRATGHFHSATACSLSAVCACACPDPPLVLSSPTGHVVFAPHPFALALPRVLGARPRAQLDEERRQDRGRQDRGAPRRRSTPARAPPDKCRRSTCICWTGRRVNYNIANFVNFAFGTDDM